MPSQGRTGRGGLEAQGAADYIERSDRVLARAALSPEESGACPWQAASSPNTKHRQSYLLPLIGCHTNSYHMIRKAPHANEYAFL